MLLRKTDKPLLWKRGSRDPFALLRQMSTDMDRFFTDTPWALFDVKPAAFDETEPHFLPQIDVFERNKQLITKIDLPGMKKEDVKVEIVEGNLAISGERKKEFEEKKDQFYRLEREYGKFYRMIPLPEGVKLNDVKAVFADGVLEVSFPLPVALTEPTIKKVEIEDANKVLATV